MPETMNFTSAFHKQQLWGVDFKFVRALPWAVRNETTATT